MAKAQRMSRKELRQDEVAEAAHDAGVWIERHSQAILRYGAIVLVVAGLVAAGVVWMRSSAKAKRMRVAAGVESFLESAETSFTNVDGLSAAIDQLEPEAAAGEQGADAVASYFLALSLQKLGRTDEAISQLEGIVATPGGTNSLSAAATTLLAGLYEQQGRGSDAVSLYERAADNAKSFIPQKDALSELAALHERLGDEAAAEAVQQRISDEFPDETPALNF